MNARFVNDTPVHSITLGAYNTWDTWKLFPTTRPFVAPPKPVTKLETVKGYNGYLDYTKVLSNYMTFKDREGSWEFRVIETSKNSWKDIFNDVVSKLDGKYFDSIILQDDPTHRYKGRLGVEWKNNQKETTITIKYRLYPYKILISNSVKDWLWDDLDLTSQVDDIFYTSFRLYGDNYKSFVNVSNHAVSLSLTCGGTIKMWIGDRAMTLAAGTNKNVVQLQPGVNTYKFNGNCNVTVSYDMDEEML